MKTERRHELGTNQLADSLAHWVEAIRPYLKAIAGAAVAVAVAIFAWALINHRAAAQAEAGWDQYFHAFNTIDLVGVPDTERLEDLADKFPGTPVGNLSLLVVADLTLDQGTSLLYTNKSVGREKLRTAVDRYRKILADTSDSGLQERAAFGLARAQESLGNLDKAINEYERISQRWPGDAYAVAATARAKDLKRAGTKQFYDWFDKYEPNRSLLNEPGKPGDKESFDMNLLRSNEAVKSLVAPSEGGAATSNSIAPAESATGGDDSSLDSDDAAATDDASATQAPAQPAAPPAKSKAP